MKKILFTIGLLLAPLSSFAFATTSVPLIATTSTSVYINKINGSQPGLVLLRSTTTNATSTYIGVSSINALSSAGLTFYSNNGTAIGILGAGGGSNTTFYGGVNIDGSTRLATSLTGCVTATAGVLSASGSCGGGSGGSSKWATSSDSVSIQPNSAVGIIVGLSTTTSATSTNFFSLNASTTNATSTNSFVANVLQFPNSATGIQIYNTADQSTNYERLTIGYNSNNAYISSGNGGSGTIRDLILGASTGAGQAVGFHRLTLSSASPAAKFGVNGTDTLGTIVQISMNSGGGLGSSSGVQNGLLIDPALAQSSTAGYAMLRINPTETSLGSGSKLLIQAGTSTATSLFTVDNQGTTTVAGRLAVGTTNPVTPLHVESTTYPQVTIKYPATTGCTIGETVNGLGVLAGCTKWGVVEVLPNSTLGIFGNMAIGSTNEFSRGAAPTGGLIVGGQTGVGTSSPWAILSISSANNTVSKPLFVIASSSSAVATATPFIVDNTGLVGVGTNAPTNTLTVGTSGGGQTVLVAGKLLLDGSGVSESSSNSLTLTGGLQNGSGANINLTKLNNRTYTSGTGQQVLSVGNFSPTSGTGIDNSFEIQTTVNQTGGANGITRGLYINPTLTSASDFRALEVATGNSIFLGSVGVSTSSPLAKLSVQMSSTTPSLVVGVAGSSTPSLYVGSANSQGNIGIKTASPTTNLDVNDTIGWSWTTPTQRLNAQIPTLKLNESSGSNAWQIGSNYDTAGTLSFTYGTQAAVTGTRAVITSAGFVGIATTTPWAQLSINPNGITGPAFAIGSTTGTLLQVSNGGNLIVGTGTPATLTNGKMQIIGEQNDVIQMNIQNRSAGNNCSSTYVATANNGSDTTYFGEFGINCSGYNQSAFNSQNAGDTFLDASDGALVLGTASTTNSLADIRFIAGGTASSSIKMIIKPSGLIGIATTTPSATFSVQGNTFISGNVFLGATTTSTTSEGYLGRISAWRYLSLSTATTTTWTATTSAGYVPETVAPFAGTVRDVTCTASSTAAFLGINPFIGGVSMTPSYFVSSTTAGRITFTANNTFTVGQRIGFNAGTTTTDTNAKSVSCTFRVTETP